MLILGIETSCDETGAAVVFGQTNSQKVRLLSNVVASSVQIHSESGGIIPENAAREQIKFIIPVIKEALKKANIKPKDFDSIAVTSGPGLIGSLLIGVETAKTLSYALGKPLIPVNHLLGHIYANFVGEISNSSIPQFPAVCLIVSGGHTDLVLLKRHGSYEWLGGTRDDAAGEAFDKIGRLLGLPYPGGPAIEKASERGDASRFTFPSPLINSNDFDFSFSGLKTAVLRELERGVTRVEGLPDSAQASDNRRRKLPGGKRVAGPRANDISASVQKAIIDVLVSKTLKAAKQYNAKSILLGGGVAANSSLRDEFSLKIENLKLKIPLFVPDKNLCTDNAAMIAASAFFNYKQVSWRKLDADPNLYFA